MTGSMHLLASLLCLGGMVTASETAIDGFEGRPLPAPWVFSNGPEYPGAVGNLQLIADGFTGSAARLTFDLSAGGNYVSARLALGAPLAATAISFRARAAPGVRIVFQAQDAGGQTLQYFANLPRPFSALTDPSPWYRVLVDLATPSEHWGGADDGIVHGAIQSLAILAQPLRMDAERAVTIGTADFDEVAVYVPGQAEQTLDPAAAVDPPPAVGAFNDGYGVNIHFTHDDAALDAIRDAGFTWVRMDLGWSSIEHAVGVYDFSAYDQLVAALEARGLKALFILDYGNGIYADASPPTTAAARAAFAAYARASAAHFAGHGVRYEIWNEEDAANNWGGTANAAQYAALCQQAIPAIKAGDSAALVTTGGVAGMDWSYLRGMLAAGGAAGADAISVHPYRSGTAANDVGVPESAMEETLLVHALIRSAFPAGGPALWDSEWGYSSAWYGDGASAANRDLQAKYASREMVSAWAMGFPMRIYYDIRDDGTDPAEGEFNFGLLTHDYQPKPAMVALQTLAAQMAGHRLAGMYPLIMPNVRALQLLGPTDVKIVAWQQNAAEPKTMRFPLTPQQVVGERGAALGWTSLGGGVVSVPIGTTLVYATFHRPAAPAAPTVADATSATPTLSGTTEAGALVRILDHGLEIATVTADGSGAWSWTPEPPLATGHHVVTVTATVGLASDPSPAAAVDVAGDTGRSSGHAGGGDGGGGCGGGAAGVLLALAGCVGLSQVRRFRNATRAGAPR